ncbi:MAG TPA: phytanoyl-CoA dioxygenase family protein [Bryobacteraceae bacterium]|jgi:ectoine hydroxylase-related dioxygenase (phytanoyl-CoA dioxygenase family)|nr:phytanoyl-CoA dioxygenase family protein [Bryobacteraceae bacterium]
MPTAAEAPAIRTTLLSAETLAADCEFFLRQGYLIVRNAFSCEEMEIARAAIHSNERMQRQLTNIRTKTESGKHNAFETIFVWNDTAGDDVFARMTRNYQIFERLEAIFDDRVYVYHNKVALKYPLVPGFRYHQDYFYWYSMGCLYPDMATASIAIDAATRENGCLRVLAGSHRMGRIEHEFDEEREDSGVSLERLAFIRERCEEVSIELSVGDLVIFHCNTLHGSDDNASDKSRLALLGCYNTKHNDPYMATPCGHPFFHEQSIVTEKLSAADPGKMPDFDLYITKK